MLLDNLSPKCKARVAKITLTPRQIELLDTLNTSFSAPTPEDAAFKTLSTTKGAGRVMGALVRLQLTYRERNYSADGGYVWQISDEGRYWLSLNEDAVRESRRSLGLPED